MLQPAAAYLAAEVAAHGGVLATAYENQVRRKSNSSNRSSSSSMHVDGVNAVGPGGTTPLLVACLQGKTGDVQVLLECGADPSVEARVIETDNDGEPKAYTYHPLSMAARENHSEIVKLLLACDGVDVNQVTTDVARSALYAACHASHSAMVALLLAQDGVNVNIARTDADGGATPLYTACYKGTVEIVAMLVAHGEIDVNKATTDEGVPPLFVACVNGHVEIVKLMLGCAGIDVNKACADDSATPLFAACQNSHVDIAALLLARDEIDVNKAKSHDVTPLVTACYEGHAEIVKLLLACDTIHVNIAISEIGITPLLAACTPGHTNIVQLLLADGRADVARKELVNGSMSLHLVAGMGYFKAAQFLVFYGASMTAVDDQGETPIQTAEQENHDELVEWFNAVTGWSQLRVAAGCRLHKDAALLLRKGKIDPDDGATTTVKEMMDVIATSKMKPAAMPWRNAPPVCKATAKLVADATRGWHRTTHWLHHVGVRKAVFAVVFVAARLQKKYMYDCNGACHAVDVDTADTLAIAQTCCCKATAAEEGAGDVVAEPAEPVGSVVLPLPLLPIELWFYSMRFFKRSWWKA